MDITDIFSIRRANAGICFKCPVAVPQNCFGACDPRVVMAEYSGIFLISGRIAAYLTKLQTITCISRSEENDTVFCIKIFLNAFQSFFRFSAVFSYSCHYAHSLRLQEDLSLVTFTASDNMSESVECSSEPFSVPTVLKHGFFHA